MKNTKYLIWTGLILIIGSIGGFFATFAYIVGPNGCGGIDMPAHCPHTVDYSWFIFLACLLPVGLIILILGLIDKSKAKTLNK